jgi:transposase InsO family protein
MISLRPCKDASYLPPCLPYNKEMDKCANERGLELVFSRPSKPTDNDMVESFNGDLRQEFVNEHWFMSLQETKNTIAAFRYGFVLNFV